MKESQLKTLVKAIIREALADDLAFTKDHPADLSTQMLIRRITQAEKARGVPHKDLTKMDSGQLQKYYNSIEKFDDSVYVPGHGWGGVKENSDVCGLCNGSGEGQHLINGQSNAVAASRVNKILSAASRGLFSDNSWEAINNIFKKLSEAGLDVTVTSAKYGGHADTTNGMPKFKEWQISIPFTNKNGKQVVLVGNITAHGAGSLEQPLDRYDITAYVSPNMVKPS